jgi:hypothetical protein
MTIGGRRRVCAVGGASARWMHLAREGSSDLGTSGVLQPILDERSCDRTDIGSPRARIA